MKLRARGPPAVAKCAVEISTVAGGTAKKEVDIGTPVHDLKVWVAKEQGIRVEDMDMCDGNGNNVANNAHVMEDAKFSVVVDGAGFSQDTKLFFSGDLFKTEPPQEVLEGSGISYNDIEEWNENGRWLYSVLDSLYQLSYDGLSDVGIKSGLSKQYILNHMRTLQADHDKKVHTKDFAYTYFFDVLPWNPEAVPEGGWDFQPGARLATLNMPFDLSDPDVIRLNFDYVRKRLCHRLGFWDRSRVSISTLTFEPKCDGQIVKVRIVNPKITNAPAWRGVKYATNLEEMRRIPKHKWKYKVELHAQKRHWVYPNTVRVPIVFNNEEHAAMAYDIMAQTTQSRPTYNYNKPDVKDRKRFLSSLSKRDRIKFIAFMKSFVVKRK